MSDALVMGNLGLGPAFNIRTKCDSGDVELEIYNMREGQDQLARISHGPSLEVSNAGFEPGFPQALSTLRG